MKRDQLGWVILIGGAAALAWWYFSGQGSGLVGGPLGPELAPPTNGTPGTFGKGQGAQTIDSLAGVRGAYGEQARCNATGGRFIKTVTKPAYGICVNSATFAAWMASGKGSDYLTDQDVQAWLGAYQSAQSGAGGQVGGGRGKG